MLVSNGADINARDLDGNTPIHFCSEYGHADTLKWLLVKEPQMNIKNRQKKSPIDVALSREILQVIKFVIIIDI